MRESYYSIYTKQACIFCKKTLELLEKQGKEYVVIECTEKSKNLKSVQETYRWETVPIIFHIRDGEKYFIGGYQQLEELLN
jgi:glutaredoxin